MEQKQVASSLPEFSIISWCLLKSYSVAIGEANKYDGKYAGGYWIELTVKKEAVLRKELRQREKDDKRRCIQESYNHCMCSYTWMVNILLSYLTSYLYIDYGINNSVFMLFWYTF